MALPGNIRKVLKSTFGFRNFKPQQEGIVEAIIEGRDVFAVMPTGGGKSLCYQLPAMALDGLTVVVSPLVSLMKDQVDAAKENGIPAAYLNSTLTADEVRGVYANLYGAKLKLLYISPERFALDHFSAELSKYNIRRFAIDEAHCLSEWGHDFRPDYLALASIRDLIPEASISAFTATATHQVQRDIIRILRLEDPFLVRASFDRPELTYRIVQKEDASGQIIRFAKAHLGQPGIIYHGSRAATEKTARLLIDAGVKALPYHAGLDNKTRSKNQDAFNRDKTDVIVATIAFGMGIDKSNVRFVMHADLPRSVEGYYQETGRAGRDGAPAECLLLFSAGDAAKIRYHIQRMDDPSERERAERSLQSMITLASANACRRKQLLGHFEEEHAGACGNCDVCLGEIKVADATEDARKLLSAVARTGQRFGAGHVIDVLRGADTKKIRSFRHNLLPTYGIGNDRDKMWWRKLTDDLIAQDHLKRETEQYNSLSLTGKGRDLLFGRSTFEGVVYEATKKSRSAASPAASLFTDKALVKRLKALRKIIASDKGVPPYVVFSDKTLREMAAQKPETLTEMRGISGVGEYKLEHFCSFFLEEIQKYADGEE
jgi:ATP-dependent DNA helicase RecQ